MGVGLAGTAQHVAALDHVGACSAATAAATATAPATASPAATATAAAVAGPTPTAGGAGDDLAAGHVYMGTEPLLATAWEVAGVLTWAAVPAAS